MPHRDPHSTPRRELLIERRDKIKQAYSFTKAMKTDCWEKDAEIEAGLADGIRVPISPVETATTLARICGECQRYVTSIRPKTNREYYYEDFVSDKAQSTVEEILADFSVSKAKAGQWAPVDSQTREYDRSQIHAIKTYFGLAN